MPKPQILKFQSYFFQFRSILEVGFLTDFKLNIVKRSPKIIKVVEIFFRF